jgi:hypothetical protein
MLFTATTKDPHLEGLKTNRFSTLAVAYLFRIDLEERAHKNIGAIGLDFSQEK